MARIERFRVLAGFDPQLWILFAGWVVSAMGFAMVVPFISIYFHLELGVPMVVVGTFFFLTAVLRASSQIIAGNLSDVLGRRKLMIFAQVVRGLVFYGVAITIRYEMSFILTAGVLIVGYILASFFQPVANAMVADIVPEDRRPEAYGFLRIAANIGWGIGPAAGGFLAKSSYSMLFWVAGGLAILSGLTILLFLRESHTQRSVMSAAHFHPGKIFGVFRDKRFLQFCVISLMMFLTMAQLVATLSVYARETLGISNVKLGWIYSSNAIMVVLFQLLVSKLVSRWNLILVLSAGSLLYSIGYSLLVFPSTLYGILMIIALITTAEMMVGPAANAVVAGMAPRQKYGIYMGAFGLFSTLGWSLGPFIGGIFLDYAPNHFILWLGVSVFGVIGAVGYLWFYYRYPNTSVGIKNRDNV